MTNDILLALFRTTLILSVFGGVCFLVLRKMEFRSPRLSRLVWVAVLLAGWCWWQPVISVAWKQVVIEGGRQQEAGGRRQEAAKGNWTN